MDARRQALEYFKVHAAQRLTVFNFYIALSSAVVAGYFASFKADFINGAFLRAVLGALLCFFAVVFWKLDRRTKFLINHAEDILREMEEGRPASAQLFTREKAKWDCETKKYVGWRRIWFWRVPLSYSNCFDCVYLVFFFLGLGELLWPVIHHIYEVIG